MQSFRSRTVIPLCARRLPEARAARSEPFKSPFYPVVNQLCVSIWADLDCICDICWVWQLRNLGRPWPNGPISRIGKIRSSCSISESCHIREVNLVSMAGLGDFSGFANLAISANWAILARVGSMCKICKFNQF